MWIKNTEGKPDAMLTFAIISFAVVTLNILLATIGQISFSGNEIQFETLDSSAMGVYLTATFSAYVGRRLTDKHYSEPKKETKVKEEKQTKPKKEPKPKSAAKTVETEEILD